MPHMDLRSTFIITFFLLILIHALPSFSREIYEIDYRGPETHSSVVPPPHYFRGKPHFSPPKASLKAPKTLRANTYAQNKVKKVHG
ncbi:hypothetical protein VNO77_16197 [Canavalia gladiata]|uniref:Transmembrane protein n=1 Tax=Canavalia gladiata TaxID=3824 RepID=A0AAN9QSW7_CANGL